MTASGPSSTLSDDAPPPPSTTTTTMTIGPGIFRSPLLLGAAATALIATVLAAWRARRVDSG
jgi:hypothetical protein